MHGCTVEDDALIGMHATVLSGAHIGQGSVVAAGALVTEGMDGSVCTVYVDGVENSTVNAGEMSQNGIVIGESATEPGVHTVELVKMDGDAPAIYKVAQYEAV